MWFWRKFDVAITNLALPLIRSFGPPSPRKRRGEGERHCFRLSPSPCRLRGEGAQRADEGLC
jgi:hypothetical protein